MTLSIGHWLLIVVAIGFGVWVYRTLWRLANRKYQVESSPCLGKAVLVKRDESETCSYCTDDDREVESIEKVK